MTSVSGSQHGADNHPRSFLGRLSLRSKINLTVALIFAFVITMLTSYNVHREQTRLLESLENEARDITTLYFDSLNTMMLTGTMDQRNIIRDKMLKRKSVVEVRVVRGAGVSKQYGPGFAEEAPSDELDSRALRGEDVLEIKAGKEDRVMTVVTPFRATENTGGVNCHQCHEVTDGTVNGAVRIGFSLKELDAQVKRELFMSVTSSTLFFALGLILVNLLLKMWVINPLDRLLGVVNRRAAGDAEVRAAIMSEDEIGRLGSAFNTMSDKMDEAAEREHEHLQREHAAAEALREKVDALLGVVNKVAAGDFSAQIDFGGGDAIGELAGQLRIMITQIKNSIDEKREAMLQLQKRVDRILTVVTKAAEGDLTGRIDDNSNDEIGHLAAGVQRMIDSLNVLVTQVQRSGIQVASSSTAIAATAKEQEATVAEQAATTNEIVTTATEISATAKDLYSTIEEVVKVADGTAKSAEKGRKELSRMEDTMRNVVDAVGSIASKFEVLREKANNINAVVTTITKVADQTNLLSLNAAIEAEKAGEYGFGFSVVAKEIRRLADQTAVATLDIEQMIKEMQTAVSSGVMSMEKFSEQVRHSANDVGTISGQLGDIIEQVQTLTPRFDNVHQGMQFQTQGAEHIKVSMIQLSEAAQQTVESLRESSSAIEKLNEAAGLLQSGVIKFKVRH